VFDFISTAFSVAEMQRILSLAVAVLFFGCSNKQAKSAHKIGLGDHMGAGPVKNPRSPSHGLPMYVPVPLPVPRPSPITYPPRGRDRFPNVEDTPSIAYPPRDPDRFPDVDDTPSVAYLPRDPDRFPDVEDSVTGSEEVEETGRPTDPTIQVSLFHLVRDMESPSEYSNQYARNNALLRGILELGSELSRTGPRFRRAELWEQNGGTLLMWMAETRKNKEQFDRLTLFVFQMLSAFEESGFVSSDFVEASGIGAFCTRNVHHIARVLLKFHGSEWRERRRMIRGDDLFAQSVQYAFASNLPNTCTVFQKNPAIESVALSHRIARFTWLVDNDQTSGGFQLEDIRRQYAFSDSVYELGRVDPHVMRQGIWQVIFRDEEGRGIGVVRDWFSTVARQILEDGVGLFELRTDELPVFRRFRSRFDVGRERHYTNSARIIGRFMALALIDGDHLSLGWDFPIMFYAELLGQILTIQDIAIYEPDLIPSMNRILEANSQADLDNLGGAINVQDNEYTLTMENRAELVSLYINSRTPAAAVPFMNELKRGLFEIIPREVFSDTDAYTLREIFLGSPEIDLDELKQLTDYGGQYHSGSRQIIWFWQVLAELNEEQKSNLVLFLTSSARLPLGGFAAIGKRFKIEPTYDDNKLPVTHTCSFTLDLPLYTSRDILRTKLLLSIDNAGGGMLIV
jgi:hypothetical protein